MTGEWRVTSLREAAVSLIDCDHRTPPASDDGYPYIAIPQLKDGRIDLTDVRRITRKHLIEWTRKANPQANDVILSRRCNPGETAFVPPGLECALGQNLVLLRADGTRVFPPFLRWLVRSPAWWEQVGNFINVGAVFDSLKCADIPNFRLPIPPLPEQQAIAHILGTLDDKIELNRRMNETLEQMAQAIFKSWFVDFDPVRAKAEGRKPASMDAATAALFPASFQDSALGMIPKGWRVTKLADICSTQYGYTASATDEPVGPRLLRVMDINKTSWIEWHSVPYCYISDDDRRKYSLGHGDIVVARMADPGKSAIVDESVDAVFASYLVRLQTDCLASAYYVYGFLKSRAYQEYADGARGGSVQANMNAKVIVGVDLVLPPACILECLLGRVLPLRRLIAANVGESRTLAAIRDALLPRLLSGEIRVKDAEKTLRMELSL